MFFWRNKQNYPLIITKYLLYLVHWIVKNKKAFCTWPSLLICTRLFSFQEFSRWCVLWNGMLPLKQAKKATTWQNQQCGCVPSEDSYQPGHPPSLISGFTVHRFLATHWAHSEDSDQTGRIPRLIWAFAGRTLILLVLSSRDSCKIWAVSREKGL